MPSYSDIRSYLEVLKDLGHSLFDFVKAFFHAVLGLVAVMLRFHFGHVSAVFAHVFALMEASF